MATDAHRNHDVGAEPASEQSRADAGATRGRDRKGTRADPPGMRRTSLYITADAADALEAAADHVLATLGDDIPRHVALSALLLAGAEQAESVVRRLAQQRAADLTARLAALQQAAQES